MRRLLPFAIGLGLVLLVGLSWLGWLFEEPGARRIDSLAAELDARTLLVVLAHPDDEIMVAGALADAARRGARIHLVVATRGEKGTPDVAVAGPEALGRVREAEVHAHGRVLGITRVSVWRFPDRELGRHTDEAAARIAEEIARLAPDTVLTFHPESGFTHHADHRAIGTATVQALARASGEPRLVYAVAPRRVMRTFGGEAGAAVAVKQPAATFSLPIDRAVKLRGWRIHASQARYVRRVWRVPPGLLYRFFDEEHYLVPGRSGRARQAGGPR